MNKNLLVLIGILTLLAITSSAHFLFHSAVDDMEIRYDGSTVYTTAQSHSINTWNDLGKVNIAPDTIWTYEDLTFGDYYEPSSSFPAYYDYAIYGSDDLLFNEYWMNQYTSDEKKKVALHELGHALGLDHSLVSNVMFQGKLSYTQLGSHDIEDYNQLYP